MMVENLRDYEDWARACMHVRCGLCRENCPAYSQFKLDSYSAKGKLTMLYHWLKGNLTPDDIMAERVFACTSCGLCDIACGYPQSSAIQDMKNALFEAEILPSKEYTYISERTKEYGNPYGEITADAEKILESIPESSAQNPDYLLFFGCTEIFRGDEQRSSVLKVLRSSGVSFRVITENVCCGSPAYRVGDIELARRQAVQIREMVQNSKIDQVVASCSGCYRTFTHDFEHLLNEEPGFTTIHTVQLIDSLIEQGRLNLKPLDAVITYHDPCHLGRHSGIYDEPRRVIMAIPGVKFVDMEWNRKFSKCCGAGGGLRSVRGNDAKEIASRRVREAESTGASIIATACPFCLRNLQDGAELIGSPIRLVTIESLVAELIE